MLLQMSIMLAVASTVIEGMIVWHLPAFRRIASKFKILDIAFSFGLSVLMGMMFAAEGLVMAMGGIMSTMLSAPMYPVLDWCAEHKSELADKKMRAVEIIQDTIKVIVFILRVITFPLWGPRRVKNWFVRSASEASATFRP